MYLRQPQLLKLNQITGVSLDHWYVLWTRPGWILLIHEVYWLSTCRIRETNLWRELHLLVRYLKGTLWPENQLKMKDCCNATEKFSHRMGTAMSWKNPKQSSVAFRTAETKYLAACSVILVFEVYFARTTDSTPYKSILRNYCRVEHEIKRSSKTES